MKYSLLIRPLASIEIIEAYEWYEQQKTGLGHDFLDELESSYSTLIDNPELFSFYVENIRQYSLERFPFTVVYEIFNQDIIIYSVFMTKRDPNKKRTK